MAIQFSPVIAAHAWGAGGVFSAKGVDLYARGEHVSPFAVLDDFRVNGRPFPPHPHAGFSALTYVFEDSPTGVRSRDSLGNDVVVGPGGIVILQAASGALHQEVPAEPGRELHGAQIFVNLTSKNKLGAPRTLWLESSVVPEWHGDAGDRLRIVVGSYDGVLSPLVPADPFNLIDVTLRRAISFGLRNGHYALVYVLEGGILLRTGEREERVLGDQALGLRGGGRVTIETIEPAHFLFLSSAEMREPILAEGPFIMSDRSQIEAAAARFRAGQMGHLDPLADH
jgi:redox-sensitive bicupin YhaK (pirin superfamily)